MKQIYLSKETKETVKMVNDMFLNVVNNISYQSGEDVTLADCICTLKDYKDNLPFHVYSVLYCMLSRYAKDFLVKGNSDEDFDVLLNLNVYEEVYEYKVIAENKVRETYVDICPENMVFEEMYALVYEQYLADVLKAW